ncbi:hypothetical protein K502DRAFT_368491 [Neoconidiobolus thromboides FSU 785]|nr:hypothetical protein K502DRAFT_368491 [Neoconidiobolus thromboides FSU 785]
MSHSMGGWLTEQVLKQRPDYNIKHIINLFPALCDIRNTPNGIKMCSFLFLKYPMMIAMWIIFLISLLPRWVKFLTVKLFTWHSDRYTSITVDNTGFEEMIQISDLNEEFYIKNENKLTIYYGKNDGWAPEKHYVNMKELIPNANILLCNQQIPHAFILDHSSLMAKMVTKWLKKFV